jgi:hypothetical protein
LRLADEPLLDLDPIAVWLLVGFARHLTRQRWVGEVVRSMGGDLGTIGTVSAFGHPEGLEETGRVPGPEERR